MGGGRMRSELEIAEELELELEHETTPFLAVEVLEEDMVFVALGKDVKESKRLLMWALSKFRGKRICVLHVHQPAQKIPFMGTKLSISLLKEYQVKAYHEAERLEKHKILDKCIHICEAEGVRAEKLWIEMDSIEEGIVKLISEHGIKWLCMGAAASKFYTRKMKEPKSTKAIHVCVEAPNFCHIWFICKGNLVHTRESKSSGGNTLAGFLQERCALGPCMEGIACFCVDIFFKLQEMACKYMNNKS